MLGVPVQPHSRLTSGVFVPLQNPPGSAPARELESHEKTRFVEPLAIDNFPLHGGPLVNGGHLYLISGLPTMRGANAHAAGTEIIGVGFSFDFNTPGLDSREPHHHHDGESFFGSAG